MTTKLLLRELSRYQLGTFADIIYRNAILYPDSEAFVCGSERVSFKSFNERVNGLIHGLQALDIHKGDIIGILSWNRLEYPEVFGASMKGGFVLAHFNPRLQAEELIHVINDSEARVVFLGPEFGEMIARIHKRLSKAELFLTFGNAERQMIAYREVLESHSNEEPEPRVRIPLLSFIPAGRPGSLVAQSTRIDKRWRIPVLRPWISG